MKKILLTLVCAVCAVVVCAQPSAVKKASKSLVKVTTYNSDGGELSNGYGIFMDAEGTVLTAWKPFVGARSAVVTDMQGKRYDVDCLYGASEYYNMARLKVNVNAKDKIVPAVTEQGQCSEGTKVWYVGYGGKTPNYRQYNVTKTETFMTDLPYYVVEQAENPVDDNMQGSPCFNEQGQLLGVMNTSSTRTDLYFASARYAASLVPGALSVNDNNLRKTSVRLALPDDYSQAMLALLVMSQRSDSANYGASLNEFIAKFPDKEDGYVSKAQWMASYNDFKGADDCFALALEKTEKKDNVHYSYSQLIYNKVTLNSGLPYESWTLDKALEEVDAANAIAPSPMYDIHRGKVLYSKKDYEGALKEFTKVNANGGRDAELYYYSYQCMRSLNMDKQQQLEMLDSATVVAPEGRLYLAEKTLLLLKMGKAREAAMAATQLIAIAPDLPDAHGFLGLALCLGGNTESGVAELKRAKAMGYEKADAFITAYGNKAEKPTDADKGQKKNK